MELSQDDWKILSTLLDAALELPTQQRGAWLELRADVPPHLRSVAADMLTCKNPAFDLPPLPAYKDADLDPLLPHATQVLSQGDTLGPYQLLREIGRGGMGTVWLAQGSADTIQRKVALKLPYSALNRNVLKQRFVRERDILAALAHPHIARLYDAGVTESGQPYLAMEYVDGQPIGSYCDAKGLDIAARLRLFQQVLAAVHYAHSQLVVHRDLKPNNVLVTTEGYVRLLDFGIAKILSDGRAEETELTHMGGRAFTPQYAAPEQILGQTVSAAVDVYALGVMLYELLTGVLPYKPKRDSRGALEEAILENDTTAPSRAVPGVTLSAAQRKALRGDLDTIVLKALKKQPEDRYATVAAFADDIERYLKGEAVLAQADSALYRARKFLLRNRWGVAAATLVVTSLAVGLGVSLWQAKVARKEAATATAVRNFMEEIFLANSVQQGDPHKARQTTARELLDIGADKLETGLQDAPEARLVMLKMFAELYGQLALNERSTHFVQQLVALTRSIHGAQSLELAEALMMQITVLHSQSPDHPQIESALIELDTLLEHRSDANAAQRSAHAILAADYFAERDIHKAAAHANRAIELLRQNSDISDAAIVLSKAAKIDLLATQCIQARALATEGIAAAHRINAEAQAGNGGNTVLAALSELSAQAAWCQADFSNAEKHFRDAQQYAQKFFGDADMETVYMQAHLADFLIATYKNTEGAQWLRQAEAILNAHDNKDLTRLYLEALAAVGHAQLRAGNPGAALENISRYVRARSAITASVAMSTVLRDQTRAYLALGRKEEAAQALERAVTMRTKSGLTNAKVESEEATLRNALAQFTKQTEQNPVSASR